MTEQEPTHTDWEWVKEVLAVKERAAMLELVPSQDVKFLLGELAKYKRGAKTLGEIIEKQCRDVLEVTGLHHLINEDGDGAWDVVWMRLFEMREELKDLKESTIARERKRGDAWRDRAQEMDSRAQSLEAELQAAKPQQITTAVELAALPRFTVIRSAEGSVFERQTMWHEAGSRDLKYWTDIALPATVLQMGWGEE
ncbi:hypothetical protein NIBR502772_05860 [Pseudarthrobacter sp. NIBRBAC000502772]|uniref:hypothetical protein n=1 Tax=Pseudarthrobacter sp. NIBRBAC000502772 TaxID=2590775 RepID=UPI0011306522|nr:hypothetical protein [Pseudarthrobacter sp. NIBRBAC000502772]QDG65799.1 hypothetical protein NIBR502772_05860 [Pseudarthrobacter sp. NIBRBAC000502772]